MRSVKRFVTAVIAMIMFFCVGLLAQEKSAKEFKYGGAKTCKACHLSKKSGAQYKVWEAGPHAKAFEVLKSEKAIEVGKKMGVEEPSTSAKCLKCHVTAFGVDAKLKGPKFTSEEGVGCEACHGAGSGYKSRKVMKALYAGTLDAAEHGLVKPVTEKVCLGCHNEESPTYKKFVFKDRIAAIAHPVPAE